MELIEVTVRFNTEGDINPLQFNWNGSQYPVISTGRNWSDESGYHILVMVPGERVFELLFTPSELRWYLSPVGFSHTFA